MKKKLPLGELLSVLKCLMFVSLVLCDEWIGINLNK